MNRNSNVVEVFEGLHDDGVASLMGADSGGARPVVYLHRGLTGGLEAREGSAANPLRSLRSRLEEAGARLERYSAADALEGFKQAAAAALGLEQLPHHRPVWPLQGVEAV